MEIHTGQEPWCPIVHKGDIRRKPGRIISSPRNSFSAQKWSHAAVDMLKWNRSSLLSIKINFLLVLNLTKNKIMSPGRQGYVDWGYSAIWLNMGLQIQIGRWEDVTASGDFNFMPFHLRWLVKCLGAFPEQYEHTSLTESYRTHLIPTCQGGRIWSCSLFMCSLRDEIKHSKEEAPSTAIGDLENNTY